MLTDVWADARFYIYLFVPIVLALLGALATGILWKRGIKERKLPINSENFRNPINATLTLIGILIPLLSTCVAYLRATLGADVGVFAPLVASLLVLILALLLSFWNLYSLATVSDAQQIITIDKENNLYFPAQFVLQLFLLLAALIGMSFFLLFHFRLPSASTKATNTTALYLVVRSPLRVGMAEADVLNFWGKPEIERPVTGGKEMVYRSLDSEFAVTIEKGKIKQFLEKRP